MRPEKQSIYNEVGAQLRGGEYVVLADYKGMAVARIEELRRRLSKVGAQFHVVKNTMLEKQIAEAGWGKPGEEDLRGPTAMVTGPGDICEAIKILQAFKQECKMPELKFGILEKRILTSRDVDELGKLPPKSVLHAMLAGTLASPLAGLVGVMQQKVASLLYVLKAAADRKGGVQPQS